MSWLCSSVHFPHLLAIIFISAVIYIFKLKTYLAADVMVLSAHALQELFPMNFGCHMWFSRKVGEALM